MDPAHTLSGLGWRNDLPAARAWCEAPDGRLARVSAQHRSGYEVSDGQHEFAVQAPAPWTRKGIDPELRAVVGDFVRLHPDQDLILEWLPRSSLFRRGAAGEQRRVQAIAANIDTVLVVTGLDRDFNLRRLERYLVLIRASGATPVLVLTKLDRCEAAPQYRDQLDAIAATGVPVVMVNAKDRTSVAQLDPWLGAGQSVVLVGSSGAGKSTLTNTLLGREKMKTGAVRTQDSRGRHTTTHRALLTLPQGGCLIDTPGMRELKLTGVEDVADQVFDDIEALALDCRFRDCRHHREPGCAVRAALASGALDGGRFANYAKLLSEQSERNSRRDGSR
ncbi:MAG TPA: ribosome small subunit-dependent GTPase A [Chiayiivirga sp.]|nr:ribosome small subunit-dependent GTPase A [Chiayiivirga sp.]